MAPHDLHRLFDRVARAAVDEHAAVAAGAVPVRAAGARGVLPARAGAEEAGVPAAGRSADVAARAGVLGDGAGAHRDSAVAGEAVPRRVLLFGAAAVPVVAAPVARDGEVEALARLRVRV